jgi:hypothetical protein
MLSTNRNFGQIDFYQQNWPFDLQVGCVKPTNLAFA